MSSAAPRPARIKTVQDAYNDGYAVGSDRSGMLGGNWPALAARRGAFTDAWARGAADGGGDRRDRDAAASNNPKRKTMKRRKLRRVARRGGRTMTVTTSSRVVKTTRMNPRGLSLEPYRRNFRFGRDRHFENIDHSPSSKNIRSMMRVLFPTWTKEQHVERLIALSRMIHVAGGVWGRIADRAHAETFPGKRRGFADYKVSGVGRDEYPERLKGRLRVAARAESTITRAIHAHAMMAGKAALRRAGITEAAMSSYRNNPYGNAADIAEAEREMERDRLRRAYQAQKSNPGGDRFRKTAEFMSDDGTHSFRAGKNLDAGTWDDRLYVDTGTGFKHKASFGYDGHDTAADAAQAAKANRDWHDGKRSTRPNPRAAATRARVVRYYRYGPHKDNVTADSPTKYMSVAEAMAIARSYTASSNRYAHVMTRGARILQSFKSKVQEGNNPPDPRTAQTQRIPMIRVMIPAGSKDPRTAETRRLRVVTSVHRKNPVRSLAVPRTMWQRLKRADKRMKHGHRYVRCKTRRARRAFWLPCTVR